MPKREVRGSSRRVDAACGALAISASLLRRDVRTGHVMKNGLYSIHVSLQDGRAGKGSGVVVFRDGRILGGDAYLFYTRSYTWKGDTFQRQVPGQRPYSRPHAQPLFA